MSTLPTEAETRKNTIDRQLETVGWSVARGNLLTELPLAEVQAGEPPTRYQTDSEFADYALLGRDRNPIAIVEAKRTSRDALAGKRQAADYADHIRTQYSFDPFIFLSNGKTIWFWDRDRGAPRKVSGFFKLYDLERLLFQREHRLDLTSIPINPLIVDRPYQHLAIRRVYEQLAEGHRKFLLVMATGTGKTRTTIALIDGLLRARWAQKVLFLADRRELVKQALGEIKDHLPNESHSRIEGGEVDHTARIFVATYPSMMQALDEFSPGYFDLEPISKAHTCANR